MIEDTVPAYISEWAYRHGFFKTAMGVEYPIRPHYPVPTTIQGAYVIASWVSDDYRKLIIWFADGQTLAV